MYIHDLKGIDWKKVCNVHSTRIGNYWYYSEIDRDIMFSQHRSWVYAITHQGHIKKIGETGNPLGVEGCYSYDSIFIKESQPKIGTQSRLGRYRKNDGSDLIVREGLRQETLNNKGIEIYAYQCPESEIELVINDQMVTVKSQINKQLEKIILDKIREVDGCYPFFNSGRY